MTHLTPLSCLSPPLRQRSLTCRQSWENRMWVTISIFSLNFRGLPQTSSSDGLVLLDFKEVSVDDSKILLCLPCYRYNSWQQNKNLQCCSSLLNEWLSYRWGKSRFCKCCASAEVRPLLKNLSMLVPRAQPPGSCVGYRDPVAITAEGAPHTGLGSARRKETKKYSKLQLTFSTNKCNIPQSCHWLELHQRKLSFKQNQTH